MQVYDAESSSDKSNIDFLDMIKTEDPVGREYFYSIREWGHFTTGPHAEKPIIHSQ